MIVACHFDPPNRRSRHIAHAWAEGAAACGDTPVLVPNFTPVRADACAAYGWSNPAMFQHYRATGRSFVYVDLGWWERKPGKQPLDGFHKVSVNGREPVTLMDRHWPSDRFTHFRLQIQPWRRQGHHIVLAGMSAKSARTRGYRPQQWETGVLDLIRAATSRPVVYRPKPSWLDATPIAGTTFSPAHEPIANALAQAWMLVTLHSNAAIDALISGVPVFAKEGVATRMSTPLSEIETPRYPEGREQLMCDIAYMQWNVGEIRSGLCWAHLKRAGVL